MPPDLDPRLAFFAPWPAKVVDVDDPLGLQRVRMRVPGLIDKTSWATARGTIGGGSKQRGCWIVPPVGSDVIATFAGADPERPYYECAHWGILPSTGSEMAANIKDLPVSEIPLVQCLQVGSVVVTFDERPGQRKFSLEDLVSGDKLVMDLEKQGIEISATSALILKSVGAVAIEGLSVTVNGRVVRATGKPL